MIGHHELQMAVNYGAGILRGMDTANSSLLTLSNSDEPRLGVDIGRVIIAGDGPDTSFVGGTDEDALRTPEVPGACEALTRLHRLFEGRVWLVSKCGARVEARTRRWLAAHRFFETTSINPDQIVFCRARPEKAPICARLRITCFVDDRWDVLASMSGIVPGRILFGASVPPVDGVIAAANWVEAEAAVVSQLRQRPDSRCTEGQRAP